MQPIPPLTVVFVEEDALVAMNGAEVLQEAGYRVVAAEGVAGALSIMTSGQDVGAIVIDAGFAGASLGVALACRVRDNWPAVRVVLTSGRPRSQLVAFPEGAVYLPKPWSSGSLVRAINEMLQPGSLHRSRQR